jgi:hypothetical protein
MWKPDRKRRFGRSNCRCDNNIKMNFKGSGDSNIKMNFKGSDYMLVEWIHFTERCPIAGCCEQQVVS